MSTAAEVSLIENSCQEIMTCISGSSLNFSVNLTPYSMYITVRKSFSKKPVPSYQSRKQMQNEIKLLREKTINFEMEKDASTNGQNKVSDETIKRYKTENLELRETLANFENECKVLKKALDTRDKEIYDLRKENKNKDDKLTSLKATLDEQTAMMKRENKKQEKKLKKQEKKDFLNNLSSDTMVHLKCEMCDETFASQSVLSFHTRSVHTASVSAQTDAREIQDHSSQTDVVVEDLNSCDECEKTFDVREGLKKHICALHGTNVSVQTEEKLFNLAMQAHDSESDEQSKIFKHKYECHGRTEKSSMGKLKPSLRQLNVSPFLENTSLPNLLSFPPVGFPLHGSSYFPPL